MEGQLTYGDACECESKVEDIGSESKVEDIGSESKVEDIGSESKVEDIGSEAKDGDSGSEAKGGRMVGGKCVCGPSGNIGSRGDDSKGRIPGQKIIRARNKL